MKLEEIYSKSNKDFVLSYEVFPPKNDIDGVKFNCLFAELEKLNKYNPSLISVTYGAGGSNQNLSIEIIKKLSKILMLHQCLILLVFQQAEKISLNI